MTNHNRLARRSRALDAGNSLGQLVVCAGAAVVALVAGAVLWVTGGVATVLVFVVVLGLFVWFVVGMMVVPLRNMAAACTRLGAGERDVVIPVGGTVELGQLARAFNAMVREVGAREELFRGLLESAPDAMVVVNEEGEIERVNAQAEALFGYRREELIGRPVEMLVPERLRQAHVGRRDRFLAEPRARPMHVGMEMLARRRDGVEMPVEVSLSPLATEKGVLVLSAVRDVSERKRAERARERLLRELRDAQRIARLGSWRWDPHTDQVTWSEEMYRIFGRDPQDGPATSEAFLAYVHPEDRERLTAGYAQTFGGGPSFELDYRICGGDRVERVLHSLGSADRDNPGCYLGTVQDVTELRGAELAARAAEERFRGAFDDAPIGMALVSLDGRFEQANAALGVICGRTPNELVGLGLRTLVHPGDVEQGGEALQALIDGETEQLALELRFMHPAGSAVDSSVHGTLLRDAVGRPTHVLCQFEDVTDRKRFEEQLQFMADHDPLTGLLNRRKFEAELDSHVSRVRRYGPAGALLVLDIDHFKHVNDTLGHNAGDELIVSIAGLLRRRLRESDILARLGGDEFAVLLPNADETEAGQVADALLGAVRTSTTLLDGQRKKVTGSIGVTTFDADIQALSGETILIEADLAMYDAKEAGRDRCAFYRSSEHRVSRTKARLTWASRIEHALENDRFSLAAQPILDLHTGKVQQHELLLRMLDENEDLIPPATFLYIAERFALIARLDEWVTIRAIELIEQRPDLQLEVNISGRSLGDQRLLKAIDDRLCASRINPEHVIFEVTETAAVANITEAQAFAKHLRDLGCRFALDDFGAGFGSFYYLKHLPFDYVKIDGEFVQHAVTGHIDQLVIKAVVGIAQGLGKETIAEFVTNEKTKRIVQRLGVDYAQGHYIGTPVLVADLLGSQHPHHATANR